mmetsp:Transcript_17761/g.49999  ORF Transcript_17761/g.49999 Transcript_17761/m.49999 type:complete len:240 (-) Transcript_17761:305-1024(-)
MSRICFCMASLARRSCRYSSDCCTASRDSDPSRDSRSASDECTRVFFSAMRALSSARRLSARSFASLSSSCKLTRSSSASVAAMSVSASLPGAELERAPPETESNAGAGAGTSSFTRFTAPPPSGAGMSSRAATRCSARCSFASVSVRCFLYSRICIFRRETSSCRAVFVLSSSVHLRWRVVMFSSRSFTRSRNCLFSSVSAAFTPSSSLSNFSMACTSSVLLFWASKLCTSLRTSCFM